METSEKRPFLALLLALSLNRDLNERVYIPNKNSLILTPSSNFIVP